MVLWGWGQLYMRIYGHCSYLSIWSPWSTTFTQKPKAGLLALVTMEYAIRIMLQRLLQWCYIITGETKLACHQRSRALAVSFHTLLVTSCCRHPGHQDRESTNVTADLLQMSAAACRRWPQQTKDNSITLIRLSNRYSITAWGTVTRHI